MTAAGVGNANRPGVPTKPKQCLTFCGLGPTSRSILFLLLDTKAALFQVNFVSENLGVAGFTLKLCGFRQILWPALAKGQHAVKIDAGSEGNEIVFAAHFVGTARASKICWGKYSEFELSAKVAAGLAIALAASRS